jgi:hypothetical protein
MYATPMSRRNPHHTARVKKAQAAGNQKAWAKYAWSLKGVNENLGAEASITYRPRVGPCGIRLSSGTGTEVRVWGGATAPRIASKCRLRSVAPRRIRRIMIGRRHGPGLVVLCLKKKASKTRASPFGRGDGASAPGTLGDFGDRACQVRNLTRAVPSQGNANPRARSWANASPESGTALLIAPTPPNPLSV